MHFIHTEQGIINLAHVTRLVYAEDRAELQVYLSDGQTLRYVDTGAKTFYQLAQEFFKLSR